MIILELLNCDHDSEERIGGRREELEVDEDPGVVGGDVVLMIAGGTTSSGTLTGRPAESTGSKSKGGSERKAPTGLSSLFSGQPAGELSYSEQMKCGAPGE